MRDPGGVWRPGPVRGTSGGRRALGIAGLALVLALVAGGVAFLVLGGGDDEEQRRADDRRAVLQVVRDLQGAAQSPPGSASALCTGVTSRTRDRLERLVAIGTADPQRRGCEAAVAYVPWRLRPITAGRAVAETSWSVSVDGDRATVRRGPGGVLRHVRAGDTWRADLAADPVWAHRAAVAGACTRAGRSLAGLRLPRTSSGVRAYARRYAGILETLARRVSREDAPAGLTSVDRGLVRATRRAAARMRRSAQRLAADGGDLRSVLRFPLTGRIDLVSQLPSAVQRRFSRAVGPCFLGTALVADPTGVRRFDRRCTAGMTALIGRLPVDTPSEAATFFAAGRRTIADIARRVGRLDVAAGQVAVRRDTVRGLRRIRAIYGELAADVRARRLPTADLERRLAVEAVAVDLGLNQLGTKCEAREGSAGGAALGTPV
jgi:hypothetical protein